MKLEGSDVELIDDDLVLLFDRLHNTFLLNKEENKRLEKELDLYKEKIIEVQVDYQNTLKVLNSVLKKVEDLEARVINARKEISLL